MIDEQPIRDAIAHAIKLRDSYRGKDRDSFKFWKQEVYRLESDLLRVQRINIANEGLL